MRARKPRGPREVVDGERVEVARIGEVSGAKEVARGR
jgi:hypothetical protein